MSTVQAPIIVNENEPLDASTVTSSPSLTFDINQTVATEDFTDVAIIPISPSASNITFNEFTGSISYNPYPYSIESASTVNSLDVSNECGNKINLLGYSQVDVNINGAIQTLVEGTDYTISSGVTEVSTNPTLLPVLTNLASPMFEFESIQVGNYIYFVGGLSDISVSDTTVTKTYTANCYYSYINTNGVMSELQPTSALPVALARGYLTVLNGNLIYMGGENNSGVVDTVYTAAINADGSLAAWVTSATTLPLAGSYIVGATVSGYVYLMNLYPGPKSSTSSPLTEMDYYYATWDSSTGTLGTFTDGGINLFGSAFYYGGYTLVMGTTIYVMGGMDYDGGFHKSVYTVAISQTNTLSAAVNTNNPLPGYFYDFAILTVNNDLYLIGAYQEEGLSGYPSASGTPIPVIPTNYSSFLIYTAPTASDTIGPWGIFEYQLPVSTCRGSAFVTNNKIYVIGGVSIVQNLNPTAGGNDTGYDYGFNQTVYTSNILAGALQAFEGPLTLNANTAQYQTIQVGNRVYAIGGYNNGIANTNIYYAIVKENDELSQWKTSNQTLIANIWGFSLVRIQNYIYLIGGFNGTSPVNTIYAAMINSDNSLTPFVLVGSIPEPLSNPTTYVGNNTLYLIAGLGTQQPSSAIYTSPISSTGTLGAWTSSSNELPLGLRNASSVVTADNTLYVFGNSTTVPANNIAYSIPISSDGSLGPVNTTALTLPATTSQYLTANLINDVIYLVGNNNADATAFDIFTTTSTAGALGTWTTVPTNLPVGAISQSVFNVGNMFYVMGVTDNVKYYNNVYQFIMNFNYSHTLTLSNALTAVPTNLYLTQFVYGSGLVASGGYLQTLTINATVFSNGMYTFNYNPIYNTNNGDTVYFQFNNMNKGDLITAFRGVIIGVEAVPEGQLTT